MSLLETLEEILGENGTRRDKRLKNWNDTVESLISASPEEQVQAGKLWQEKNHHHSKDRPFEYVASVSQRLAQLLVLSLGGDAEKDVVGASVDEQASQLLQVWKQRDATGFFFLSREETTRFVEILRTSKNFLRWYIQMFSAAHTGSRPHEVVGMFSLTSMLELSLELLDRIVEEDVARHAASLFLYATYNPVSGSDENLQRAFQELEDTLFTRILRRMLVTKTPPLALSLVRIIHNAVASYPNSTAHVNETTVDISTIDDASRLAPWAPQEGTVATFKQVFRDMIVWSLQDGFPGDADDFRGELVLEVLRTFYAIRMGLICTVPVADERFAKALVDLLKLDIHQDDERSYECLLATIALLMDSDPSFVDYILEHHCENAILSIFEKQVGRIFESKRIDDSAAASLVPSLVVLHNYSKDSPTFRSKVKAKLFPPDAETDFRRKIEEEKHDENPKNMKPLDAPEGTLRYKVIMLLSLPQGHIKRFTGELLWILCGCDTAEFIRRVGIGYGVNILNIKGALQLPASVQQG